MTPARADRRVATCRMFTDESAALEAAKGL